MNNNASFLWRLLVAQKSSTYRCVALFVLVLALVVRTCVWAAYLNRTNTFVRPDTWSYLEPGIQLLNQGYFPSYSRTPVYPLFLAVVSKALSPDPAILALVQIAVSLATILLMYFLCSHVLGAKTALLALFFMALDITSAISANHLLSETIFTFILAACLVGLMHIHSHIGADRTNLLRILPVGIGFSVLPLCRPITILLFVVVAFWLYVRAGKRKPYKAALILCFVTCSVLLPLSWIIRNHAQTGTYFFTTISSTNIYEYRAAWNVSRLSNRPFSVVQDEFEKKAVIEKKNTGLNEGELARWKQSEGIRILKDNPLLTLQQGLDGLVKMYLGISGASINELADWDNQEKLKNAGSLLHQRLRALVAPDCPLWIVVVKVWAMIYLTLLYSGVAVAFVQVARHRFFTDQRHLLWLMFIVIAYFTFFSVGAEAYSRFRVPIAPPLSVLGAVGWIAIFGFIRRKILAPRDSSFDNSENGHRDRNGHH